MHLDHKIPWKTTASHFRLQCSTTITSNFDLVALDLLSQSSTLGHFSRVLSATIKEFSQTEVAKINQVSATTKLFSDNVLFFAQRHFGLDSYAENSALHNPLSPSHQNLEYWQRRVGDPASFPSNGGLADAVKMLVIVAAVAPERDLRLEALSALSQLAADGLIPQLRNVHWGHAFGTDLVAGVALQAYMLLNLTEAVQCRQKDQGSLLKVEPLLQLLSRHALQDYDYPAQNVPHRAFWSSLGVTDLWTSRQLTTGGGDVGDESTAVDPLDSRDDETHRKARSGLQQYLKDCFAILYVYDVLLRQACGPDEAEEFWASEIASVLRMLGCRMED